MCVEKKNNLCIEEVCVFIFSQRIESNQRIVPNPSGDPHVGAEADAAEFAPERTSNSTMVGNGPNGVEADAAAAVVMA